MRMSFRWQVLPAICERHSVNLVQKGFIRVALKRYIIREVLVKEPFQFFFGDILIFKDIAVYETWDFSPFVELSSMRKNPQHFVFLRKNEI